jgi:hypothetical protein
VALLTIPNDPYGKIKPDKKNPEEVIDARSSQLAHAKSDVDSGQFAQHHTLGSKRNQASPGDHTHTGKDSRLLGKGAGLSISGSRGGNAAVLSIIQMLQQIIDFNDGTTA